MALSVILSLESKRPQRRHVNARLTRRMREIWTPLDRQRCLRSAVDPVGATLVLLLTFAGCANDVVEGAPGIEFGGRINATDMPRPRLRYALGFGAVIAADNDTFVVGVTPNSTEIGPNGENYVASSGVHVFERFGDQWLHTNYLHHPLGVFTVDLEFDHILVKRQTHVDIHQDVVVASDPCGITVFERDRHEWAHIQVAQFQRNVFLTRAAVHGETIAVAASEEIQANGNTTTIHVLRVYTRTAPTWTLTREFPLKELKCAPSDIALSATTIAVSSMERCSPLQGEHNVVVFERESGIWTKFDALRPPSDDHYLGRLSFGASVAIHDRSIAVAAGNHVALFEPEGRSWRLASKLTPSNPSQFVFYDLDLEFDGDRIIAATPYEFSESFGINNFVDPTYAKTRDSERRSYPSGREWGAVYVFERYDDGWKEHYYIKQSTGQSLEPGFGQSVALADGSIFAGHPTWNSRQGRIEVWNLLD